MNKSDIFVVCGELSGDQLGYSMLKDLCHSKKIEGVLGPNMQTLPIQELLPMDCFNFMGFTKPLASIFRIISSFRKITNHILRTNPKVVLLIDLPDINLRIAKHLKKKKFAGKVIQVVCPTIWAWRPKRKKILEKYYDHLCCLFPFEKELFKDSTLKVSYIGHPLTSIQPKRDKVKKVIAVFPGSRKQTVQKLLPTFLEICKGYKDFEIHVSCAKKSLIKEIEKISKGYNIQIVMPEGKEHLLQSAFVALTKNGTINLELALQHVPQVTCYTITRLEKFLLTWVFSAYIPHYSLPNILLGKRIVPELIGPFATKQNIKKELDHLLKNSYIQETMKSDYQHLSNHLKNTLTESPKSILQAAL